MPEVSVVLPVRNAAATLDEAIASCLGQTSGELEVRLVLNGCSDGSGEIARSWAARDRRVIISHSPVEDGISGALNAGWQSAIGRFVMRMDADDLATPTRAEAQIAALESDDGLDAVGGLVELDTALGDGMRRHVEWLNSLTTPQAISAGRFIECPVAHPSMMIRREVLQRLGGYRRAEWAEDHDLWLRLLEAGGRIGKVDEVVLVWRDRPERLTRTDPRYAMDRVWRMKAHFLGRLPEARDAGVVVAGAGPIGKRLAGLLQREGLEVKGFFDVSPRRIGMTIGGLAVADAGEIGRRWRDGLLLSAVGIPGGRDQVRGVAHAAGYVEGRDFWCCC